MTDKMSFEEDDAVHPRYKSKTKKLWNDRQNAIKPKIHIYIFGNGKKNKTYISSNYKKIAAEQWRNFLNDRQNVILMEDGNTQQC